MKPLDRVLQKVPPKTAREEAAVPLPDRVRPAEEV